MDRIARELLEHAKAVGFVYEGRWPRISNDYFDHCVQNGLPYVRIRARRARVWASDISVDMTPTGKVLTPAACEKAIEAMRLHADRRARVMAEPEVVAADRVHRKHWEPLAGELFQIATSPGAQASEAELRKAKDQQAKAQPECPRRSVHPPAGPPSYDTFAVGLNRRQQEQLLEAIHEGFVFERGPVIVPATQGPVASAYRRYCEAARRVYIEVFCGSPKMLRLDMSPTGNDLCDEAVEGICSMITSMRGTHLRVERTPALTVTAAMSLDNCTTAAWLLVRDVTPKVQIGMPISAGGADSYGHL